MLCFKKLVFRTILFLSFVPALFAQNQESTLIINIKNQLGEVIVDAEITLLKAGKTEKLIKSNKSGVAQFNNLLNGEYQINITAKGFSSYRSEIITISKGQTKKIMVVLEVIIEQSNVIVAQNEEVTTDNLGDSRVLSESAIEKLPDDPKQLEKYIKSIAGLTDDGEAMPITVDGAENGKIPPKEAIQMIRVNRSVFSSQYDRPVGGGVEIFTKANIAKFSGGIGFSFEDSRFNASNPFIGKKIPMQNRGFNLNLNGPITKTTSFYSYGGFNFDKSSVAINAITLNSALQSTPLQTTFSTPNKSIYLGTGINSDLNKKHKLRFNYGFNVYNTNGQGVGEFSLPSKSTKQNNQSHYLNINETFLINENIVNQTNFNSSYSVNKSISQSKDVALNVSESFNSGGSQNDRTSKNFNFEFSNNTTWQIKNYSFGFGGKIRGNVINQNSLNNFGGTYTFAGRNAVSLDANNKPIFDNNGNQLLIQITSLEAYRRTLYFKQLGFSPTQIRILGGGASQFSISGGNPQLSANQFDYAIYQQNSYKFSDNLAVVSVYDTKIKLI